MKGTLKKFKEDVIELLWKYDVSVLDFVTMVRKDEFWIDIKKPNKKLLKALNKISTKV